MRVLWWCLLSFVCMQVCAASAQPRPDARTIHRLYQEQTLERKIKTMLDYNKHMKYDSDLTVRIYQSVVIVIGSVSDREDIQDVKSILEQRAPDLTHRLYIRTVPELDRVGRSADSFMRLKVRFSLLRDLGWAAGQIRVVVYQKHIYLIGPARLHWQPIVNIVSQIGNHVTVVAV